MKVHGRAGFHRVWRALCTAAKVKVPCRITFFIADEFLSFSPPKRTPMKRDSAALANWCHPRLVWGLVIAHALSQPMVGHNCWYDLMFLYSHFEAALPATLLEFKSKLTLLLPEESSPSIPAPAPNHTGVLRLFHPRPQVWDTKHLCTKAGYTETMLGKLFVKCSGSMSLPIGFSPG